MSAKQTELSQAAGADALVLSAISGNGVDQVLRALRNQIDESNRVEEKSLEDAGAPAWTPEN